VLPRPDAPTQSEPSDARVVNGVPLLVALPHCVTATNTPEGVALGVALGVVTLTVTLPPVVRFESGDTLTVAVAAEAGDVDAITTPAANEAAPARRARRRRNTRRGAPVDESDPPRSL
jgi:hypothetical protein